MAEATDGVPEPEKNEPASVEEVDIKGLLAGNPEAWAFAFDALSREAMIVRVISSP